MKKHKQKNTTNNQNWTVWINFCIPLVASPCVNNGTEGCMQWDPKSSRGHASMGTLGNRTFAQGKNPGDVAARFTGGDAGRSFVINFSCNKSLPGTGYPKFVQEFPALTYNFQWTTQYACPQNTSTPCNQQNTCGTCANVSNNTCEWCLDTFACTNKGDSSCSQWISWAKFCPNCNSYSNSCEECTTSSFGCGYCLDSSMCVSNGTSCNNFVATPNFCNLAA